MSLLKLGAKQGQLLFLFVLNNVVKVLLLYPLAVELPLFFFFFAPFYFIHVFITVFH